MLKSWGAWLGLENENVRVSETEASAAAAAGGQQAEMIQKASGFSGYVSKVSESVLETAQRLKKSVQEANISSILEKVCLFHFLFFIINEELLFFLFQTIVGDFQKEQQKFVQEKNAKKIGDAVPPWVGYNEEETIQHQILALSADKRNFLRDPPAGFHFHFDFEQMYPVAMVMLEEDELLQKMRFHLVPKQVKEDVFWKNYFYRVSLIKQSAELTALKKRVGEETGSGPVDVHQSDIVRRKASSTNSSRLNQKDEELSSSPHVSEFVSDAFNSCKIYKDDLRKEMEQLVLDQQQQSSSQHEDTEDWEKELQEELKEYEIFADNEIRDDNWDREIEAMLKEDS